MNTDTGQIYYGLHEIEAARRRGEPLIEITEAQVALAREIDDFDAPRLNRAQRRAQFGGRTPERARLAPILVSPATPEETDRYSPDARSQVRAASEREVQKIAPGLVAR